jgi:hypothetical protein
LGSALLDGGPDRIEQIAATVSAWMERNTFADIDSFRGLLSAKIPAWPEIEFKQAQVSTKKAKH